MQNGKPKPNAVFGLGTLREGIVACDAFRRPDYAAVSADFNMDGKADVFLVNNGQANALFAFRQCIRDTAGGFLGDGYVTAAATNSSVGGCNEIKSKTSFSQILVGNL